MLVAIVISARKFTESCGLVLYGAPQQLSASKGNRDPGDMFEHLPPNCALVTVRVVSEDIRMKEPSGNWIAARPACPVRTELPAVSASPGTAVR